MENYLSMPLFFREEGDHGTPVIMLHGLYGSSDNWLTHGRKLSVNHRVFMVDQRNHGRSPHNDVHSYDAMKEDLARFIASHNIGKAIIIGHSMGGKTAMLFGASYPELVEKLVVIDIAPKSYLNSGANNLSRQRLVMESLREMQHNHKHLISREKQISFLASKLGGRAMAMFILKSVDQDRKTNRFRFRINVEALDNSLNDMVGGVDASLFANVIPLTDYPVLFIKGERSSYISEEDFPLIKNIYPMAIIKTIPQAGHWVQADQPDLFMNVLKDFLNMPTSVT